MHKGFLKKVPQNNDAFSLIEIMLAIVIVGVSATLILPRFSVAMERVRAAEGVQILTALLGAQKSFEFENGNYTNVLANLDVEISRAQNFVIPPTVANPGNPVTNPIASIRRIGAYSLRINEEGTITCVAVNVPLPDLFTCAEAGY